LANRGFALFTVAYPPNPLDDLLDHIEIMSPGCHYLLIGSTGEGSHVVVGRGGKIVHNPAWIGTSLKEPLQIGDQSGWLVWVIARG
jgi:hypothetical protein